MKRKLKKEIFKKVTQYYQIYHRKKNFLAGKTKINYAGRIYDEKELINLIDASLDFWLTAGKYARKFEKDFAKFLGVKYCSLTNSGSSANLLAISSLTSPLLGEKRLKPKDEIITTACGFPTTLNPIIQNNLMPVFVDIELGTYNINTSQLKRAISPKTKAIFITHTLGNPANIKQILNIVKKYNIWLVEDNCDALGAKYQRKYTGSFGHLSTCSFYPAHHLTMGEGGAVLTNNPLFRRIINSLRDWGRDCWCQPGEENACGQRFSQQHGELPFGYDHKYVYSHIGYNFKITDLQAAIGCAQLKKIKKFIQLRRKNFAYLYQFLEKYQQYFLLPSSYDDCQPSWFGFPILVKKTAPFKRLELVNYLEKNKITTRMLFGGNLIKQPAYEKIKYRLGSKLANTNLVMNNLFWIGVYPGINQQMLEYIKQIFEKFLKVHRK